MRILYFDCFSGIAGDMAAGALRDLGVPEEVFTKALQSIHLPEGLHAHFHRDVRQGISGWKFHVHDSGEHDHSHEHAHAHHHAHEHSHPPHEHGHPHDHDHGEELPHVHGRSYAEIRKLLEDSSLEPAVKARAQSVFRRIAIAEGRIHGMPPEEVGFHEVGAVDSIADIVAVCAGIEYLKVDRVEASPLTEGRGWIHCAHGRFPLPAPATLAILEGIPLRQVDENSEFITPTGAAILAEFCSSFGLLENAVIQAIGYGIGTRKTPHRPNVLRALLAEVQPSETPETVEVIETNIDDLSPELTAAACDRLRNAGALDVFLTPVQMKKGRPGQILTVLARSGDAMQLGDMILRETSAFGVRMHSARRIILERSHQTVQTPFGPVQVKIGRLHGKVVQASPEFESCRQIAETTGRPVRDVFRAAESAAAEIIS